MIATNDAVLYVDLATTSLESGFKSSNSGRVFAEREAVSLYARVAAGPASSPDTDLTSNRDSIQQSNEFTRSRNSHAENVRYGFTFFATRCAKRNLTPWVNNTR